MKSETNFTVSETRSFVNQAKVVARLLESELFQSYRKTFQASTDLPLELHPVSEKEMAACRGSVNQNRFCHLLNRGHSGCRECLMAQKYFTLEGKREAQSIACFAGLQETAIPIMVGSVMVAQLKTGQIFHEAPAPGSFAKVTGSIDGVEASRAELEKAYMATPVVEKQRYQAMVTLLAAFSLQLTKLANQIGAEQETEEEDVIDLVKDYIEENLIDPIHLGEVAKKFKISPFHFCRKFKEATGMTMTNYISEQRVNLAKEALLNTDGRITDIAFNSGFQSLSQFNRNFHKITGMCPTQFRLRVVA
jgi:AraC-like DNA-binding protein